jgi:hypothetical protein
MGLHWEMIFYAEFILWKFEIFFAYLLNCYFNNEDLNFTREWKVLKELKSYTILLKVTKKEDFCYVQLESFTIFILKIFFLRIYMILYEIKNLSHCSYEFTAIPPVSHFFSINIIKFFSSLSVFLFCLNVIFIQTFLCFALKIIFFIARLEREEKGAINY